MRICLANLDFIPSRSSGLAVFGETLARGLASAGHEVVVVARGLRGLPAHESIHGIEVFRTGALWGDWLAYAWQAASLIARLAARRPFDIVHFLDVHFAWRFRGPFIASLNQSFRQRLTSEGGRPYHANWRDLVFRSLYYRAARRMAELPALARASHLTSGSQATVDAFVAERRLSPTHVTVIPTGVDLERLQRRDASALRQRLGLEGRRVLLYVGFCTPRKGLVYLARAMGQVAPEASLVIVGKWEPAYRQRFYEALGEERGRVIEAGYVADEELPTYYSLADMLVFPTLLEGFGIPLVEAMACGAPVVTTEQTGASAETAGPGALTVPPRDASALAGAINRLLHDEPLRQRLAEAGQAWVRERYDQRRMVAGYLAVYERFRQRALEGCGSIKV